MNSEKIDWNKETELYVLTLNSYIKFGITANWERRLKRYKKDFPDFELKKHKEFQLQNRWQAELIEQVMKWRLKPWVVSGRHEWVQGIPIKIVFDCFFDTRNELENEFEKHEYIHHQEKERWDHYRQIADYYFK